MLLTFGIYPFRRIAMLLSMFANFQVRIKEDFQQYFESSVMSIYNLILVGKKIPKILSL